MIQFKLSAPSKLSLFGEHAVEHKKRALTACVDLRTTLTFHELPLAPSSIFIINFPQINLFYQVPIEIFLQFYSECIQNLDLLGERVLRFTESYQSENHKVIVQAFYYLMVLMVCEERIDITSFTMSLTTDFLMDGRFVFTTSFVVCLAACLLRWARLQKGIFEAFTEVDLKKIQTYAARCQEISQEVKTIDAISCTQGSITEYVKENPSPSRPLLSPVYMPTMTILLVDSKQPQNPEVQMQQMTELTKILPETSNSIFNSIDLIAKRAYNVFHQIREIYLDTKEAQEWRHECILNQFNIIKHFISTNQNLLRALNVSHNRLDDICMIAQKHGMCAKYTDIGHGRYAYVWCPRHVDEPCNHVVPLMNDLKTRGYDIVETKFARIGVRLEPL